MKTIFKGISKIGAFFAHPLMQYFYLAVFIGCTINAQWGGNKPAAIGWFFVALYSMTSISKSKKLKRACELIKVNENLNNTNAILVLEQRDLKDKLDVIETEVNDWRSAGAKVSQIGTKTLQ